MPGAADCVQVMKASPHLQMPGFGESEIYRAVCKAMSFQSGYGRAPIENAVASLRKSYWDTATISKSVAGGLEHVISVDNAAGYAELWHQGGNWYVVTGADPNNPSKVDNMLKTPYWTINEVPGFYKGMNLEDATAYFTQKLFGPNGLAKGGCGCGGKG